MTQSIYETSAKSRKSGLFHPPPQALIRIELARHGILAVRLIGPPGSGKTELIEATMRRLASPRRTAVIVVNPAAERDAARLRPHCRHVEFIDASVPRAAFIWRAIQQLPLKDIDLILIEACGGLAPLEDLGQDATVAAFAVSGGDDKAAEYHGLLENASLVLLTQNDMRPWVKFEEYVFRGDVKNLNSAAEIIELSAVSGTGMDCWVQWLEKTRDAKKRRIAPETSEESSTEAFFG
jgi:hydrogenase nickel incorporation protein HypB